MTRYLVTGGLGFIGSAFIRRLAMPGAQLVCADSGTYASDYRRVRNVHGLHCLNIDIADRAFVDQAAKLRPDVIVHFAAESHVTRGEINNDLFFHTNVQGTRCVFEAALRAQPRLVLHISTDEVYGPCLDQPFTEEEKQPGEGAATSAYARSKALADDIAQSYSDRLPVIIARPTNCFGPWQHPEKAIPRWTTKALLREPIPVWGDGRQIRDWLFVEDVVSGLELLVDRGEAGEIYNLGPHRPQRTNLEVARFIAERANLGESRVYLTEYDRPNHDRRYEVNSDKIRALGWRPGDTLETQLASTVDWYRLNDDWWRSKAVQAELLYPDSTERESNA